MKFEAAIFDLDGTLLNSMDVWEQIDISFLQKRGLSVSADYVTEICSRSFAEAAQYTIDLFKLSEKVEDMVKEWEEMAVYEYAHNVELMPHTLEYILKLKDMGVKWQLLLVFRRSYIFPVWKITVYWNYLMSAVPRMK